ncbi:hypothetical protein T4D_508 [Trichinella pseudospiralis]|uniref:Uncharacterized protein n=1 Tax=Trichinella pseudospiralis TaxID=6337 RepID=A0A0V1FFZ2_TRIPS|nr:hypothetical protein T4D_508 [Trichinella pseudospiralis]
MHYVVTQILRYYHAVPNCASLGAHVLRFQTCLHQLPSLPSIQESCDRNCLEVTYNSYFGKVVIVTCGFSIYVVRRYSERGQSLMVIDALSFLFTPLLVVISVISSQI